MISTGPERNLLYAAYDLSVSPSSFDVLSFLVEAEKYRKEQHLEAIHFVVIPGERQFDVLSESQDKWRLANIVIPACGFLNSVQGITIAISREQAQRTLESSANWVFPPNYKTSRPIAHHHTAWPVISAHLGANLQCLRASSQAKHYARQWIDAHAGGRKVVALTLREADFTPLRNSNVAEWTRFARLLKDAGYFPVMIRDTDKALEAPDTDFDGITLFPEAAFNLDLRTAFYEECHIAAFVSNGPSHACYFDRDVHYLYFVSGEWRTGKPPAFYRVGIGENTIPPFCNAYQRWIWCEQDADLFIEELLSLDQIIEARRADGTYEQGLDPIHSYREQPEVIAERMRAWCRIHGSIDDWRIVAVLMDMTPENLYANPTFTFEQARTAFGIHDFDRAIELYQHVLRADPSEAVYLELGLVYEALNRHEDALAHYREAARALPGSLPIAFRRHVVEAACGNTDIAIAFLKGLIERGAMAPQLFTELANIYEATGDVANARAVYASAIERGVPEPEFHVKLRLLSQST